MADFTSAEKINIGLKHFLGILGTNNLDGANGRRYYEELYPASHVVYLQKAWAEAIPYAVTKAEALTYVGDVIEDRTSSESITITSSGSDWSFSSSSIVPQIGYQITDIFPNPTYIRSITAVTDHGGGNYTVTLNDNIGVSAGNVILHSRVFLTLDPTSNNLTWLAMQVQGDFFSTRLEEFISPFDFGRGYAVNLFEADGTPINVAGAGTWLFKWEEGVLVFPDGQTAVDLGYQTPLYVEGFRYIGKLGAGASIDIKQDGVPVASGVSVFNFQDNFELTLSGSNQINVSVTGIEASLPDGTQDHQSLRWDYSLQEWQPTSDILLTTSGAIVPSRLEVQGDFIVYSGATPLSSVSPGLEGQIKWDPNFLYVHTGPWGWKRHSIAPFGSTPGLPPLPSASGALGLGAVFQADFSTGTNLDVTNLSLPLEAADVNIGGVFTIIGGNSVQLSERGLYKVIWNVRGEKLGGSTQRRVLTTSLRLSGVEDINSKADGHIRDSTNNHTTSQNTYLIKTSIQNQTISIKSDQTGSGGGPGTFLLDSGHLLIEYIGAI